MSQEHHWESYEKVAKYLLDKIRDRFDIEKVEGKQVVEGHRSGTKYVIDAKGVRNGKEGFIIIECRRYTTSRQNQEKIGALAYRIFDTGAIGGILVSPLGFQAGAEKIAGAENIHSVLLDENSTTENYVLRFLNEIMIGVTEHIGIEEKATVKIIDCS